MGFQQKPKAVAMFSYAPWRGGAELLNLRSLPCPVHLAIRVEQSLNRATIFSLRH